MKSTFRSVNAFPVVARAVAKSVLLIALPFGASLTAQQVPAQRAPNANGLQRVAPQTTAPQYQPRQQRGLVGQRAPAGQAQAGQGQVTAAQGPTVPTAGQRGISPSQLQQRQATGQMQRAGQAQQRNLPQQKRMVKAGPPAPAWVAKLTPAERKRVNDLLGFWEFSSAKVQTYTTKFVRFEYDPVFGPKDRKTPRSRGFGVIRYSAPDKGEFKLDTIGEYTVPTKPGGDAYPQKPVQFDEHWICDGKSVFEFNTKTKQLIETRLPPDMQGKKIADGPLPFMFGAKKDELMARYWIREIKEAKKGQYILEIYPKRREDAMNYSRVGVIIAENDFLPESLQIYPPNYDHIKNWARTVYVFTDRQTNKPLHRTKQFFNRFVSPKPPIGWKKVVANVGGPIPSGPTPNGPMPRATATKPRATATNLQPINKAAR